MEAPAFQSQFHRRFCCAGLGEVPWALALITSSQGLTLVHCSAQREHFLSDAWGAFRKMGCGMRWVPSIERWVITRHKHDTERFA